MQGLTLTHAVLPSAQLVTSGLAAPAPLAFNLSGISSGISSSLLLDGCTIVSGCSNLAQFSLWLDSLPAGVGMADVQPILVRCPEGGQLGAVKGQLGAVRGQLGAVES